MDKTTGNRELEQATSAPAVEGEVAPRRDPESESASEMATLGRACAAVVLGLALTGVVIMWNASDDEFHQYGSYGGLLVISFLAFAELVAGTALVIGASRVRLFAGAQGKTRLAGIAGILLSGAGIMLGPGSFMIISNLNDTQGPARALVLTLHVVMMVAGMLLLLWATRRASTRGSLE